MNYIYDILLNYNSNAYDFFEWNTSDSILHVRKIPLIKVNPIVLHDIENYEINFDTSFLETIKNKTEVFNNKHIRLIDKAFLLSDGTNVLAVMIKNNHYLKSKLLLDEIEDVISISEKLNEQVIKYEKLRVKKISPYKTRKQIELEQRLKKGLKKVFSGKNNETLKYMYYEFFDKKEDSINIIKKRFYSIIEEENEQTLNKLKDFLKLLEIKH